MHFQTRHIDYAIAFRNSFCQPKLTLNHRFRDLDSNFRLFVEVSQRDIVSTSYFGKSQFLISLGDVTSTALTNDGVSDALTSWCR